MHYQSCKECKKTIFQLLCAEFGSENVISQYDLNISGFLEGYKTHPNFLILKQIEDELKAHRGFNNFVSKRKLSPVDYFVKSVGLIIEFDESQHFTKPRSMTLERYPESVGLGFNRRRWLQLCTDLNRHDNDPPHRDEQRAWYDTLRDFAPVLLGLQPIVRIYAGDTEWCNLDLSKGVEVLFPYIPQLSQALNS